MGFTGPETGDYENVVALNREWLKLLQSDASAKCGLESLPRQLRDRLTTLSQGEIQCLASTPFLLFSFRENDNVYWSRILHQGHEQDLFAVRVSADVDTLVSAAMGFAWQLAQRNPFLLRLFCGASIYWCECIGETNVIDLLQRVRRFGDVPIVRCGFRPELWQLLLHGGTSHRSLCSHAAQITALQTVLTQSQKQAPGVWQRAARSTGAPLRHVADANEATQE